MKIVFAGSGGSGKTTVARALSNLIGLPFIEGLTRKAYDNVQSGLTEKLLLESHDIELRCVVQTEIWRVYETAFYESERFIMDRSPICHLAYTVLTLWDDLRFSEFDRIMKSSKAMLDDCDLIVHFPIPEFTVPEDGFRQRNPIKEYAVDTLIEGMLLDTPAPVTYLSEEGSPKQRIATILNDMKLYGLDSALGG